MMFNDVPSNTSGNSVLPKIQHTGARKVKRGKNSPGNGNHHHNGGNSHSGGGQHSNSGASSSGFGNSGDNTNRDRSNINNQQNKQLQGAGEGGKKQRYYGTVLFGAPERLFTIDLAQLEDTGRFITIKGPLSFCF
jgi:hypothetical protein